ncbi:MAG: hypothetical protein JO104_08785 [Candidatus Eremiobacteraeota bacterium]|nr:hypothetical protein [Candidatus Eremiobacteraeota bacterium]
MGDRARPRTSHNDAEAGRLLITCASLLGHHFSLDVLAACCGTTQEVAERVLREACRSGLLVAQTGVTAEYRFHHAVSRAAIRSDLDPATARTLRARIAQTRTEHYRKKR